MAEAEIRDRNQAAALLADARRITVKVGSSLLVEPNGKGLRREWIAGLAEDLAGLRGQGRQLVLVSSGAVALGRTHLGLKPSARLDLKQAAAAAGQPLLMHAWEGAMARFGIPTAQLLLTVEDTESRRRWLNARATLEVLLARGALPVINENDSVATDELATRQPGSLGPSQMGEDLLTSLSDVDGLIPPTRAGPLCPQRSLSRASRASEAWPDVPAPVRRHEDNGLPARLARGCGLAPRMIVRAGGSPLRRLAAGEARATLIAAAGSPAGAYKQWIAGTLTPAGSVTIDEGAARALAEGRSLLPAGVREVKGSFERGACLKVLDPAGRELARGICAYGSAEAEAIRGARRGEAAERLGYGGPDELIHRDDLVLM